MLFKSIYLFKEEDVGLLKRSVLLIDDYCLLSAVQQHSRRHKVFLF